MKVETIPTSSGTLVKTTTFPITIGKCNGTIDGEETLESLIGTMGFSLDDGKSYELTILVKELK